MGTRGAWAKDFLVALGNTQPSDDTIKLVSAWTRVENTYAKYNPLGSTNGWTNATIFNSVGVKNYPSRSDGISALVDNINQNHAGYAELLAGLKTNDPQRSLASLGFDTWGSGTGKVLAAYTLGGFPNEMLRSEMEDRDGSESGGSFDDQQDKPNPHDVPYSQTVREQEQARQFGQVTENDIRNIAKITLGILLVTIGIVIGAIGVIKTDTVQSTAKVAASVATKGMI